jgi:hypothetical protein
MAQCDRGRLDFRLVERDQEIEAGGAQQRASSRPIPEDAPVTTAKHPRGSW